MRAILLLVTAAILAAPVPAPSGDVSVYLDAAGSFAGPPVVDAWPDALPAPPAPVALARFPLDANACHRRLLADVAYEPAQLAPGVRVELAIDLRDAAGALLQTTRVAQPGLSKPIGTLPAAGPHLLDLRLVVGTEASWTLRVRGLAAAGEPACEDRVLVNEIEANPAGTDAGHEWVELVNAGLFDVDVSGWRVRALHGVPGEAVVPRDTVLAPGARIVVGSPVQWLDNADEEVVLVDAFGAERDRAPVVDDGANDARTWQRVPDGAATWTFRAGTRDASNGG